MVDGAPGSVNYREASCCGTGWAGDFVEGFWVDGKTRTSRGAEDPRKRSHGISCKKAPELWDGTDATVIDETYQSNFLQRVLQLGKTRARPLRERLLVSNLPTFGIIAFDTSLWSRTQYNPAISVPFFDYSPSRFFPAVYLEECNNHMSRINRMLKDNASLW